MTLTANPVCELVKAKLCANPGLATPWSGNAFRFSSITRPSPDDIISGIGALKCGGRWNGRDTFPTIYGSTTAETAVQEANAMARYYHIPEDSYLPRLMVGLNLKLNSVLDLTKGTVRRNLSLTLHQIRDEDWRKLQDAGLESLTQGIGRAAFEAGFEALLTPSAQVEKGINIAVFPDRLQPESAVRVWGEDELRGLRWVKYTQKKM